MKRGRVLGTAIGVGVAAAAIVGWRLIPGDSAPAAGRASDACSAAGPAGLVGLDLATGAERWTNVVGDDVANLWTPGPDGDVTSAESESVWTIGSNGQVRRVKASTGAVDRCVRVTAMTPEEIGHPIPVDDTGATARDRAAGAVEVIEADESLRWQVKDLHLVGASAGGVVARASMGRSCCNDEGFEGPVQVRDPQTGEVRWEHEIVGLSAIVTATHLIVVGDGRAPGTSFPGGGEPTTVVAYDLVDGTKAWTATIDGSAYQAFADAGLVLVPTFDGAASLTAIDDATGEIRWTVELPQPGEGGAYSEAGGVTGAAVAGDTVAVAVQSAAPHRD